MTNGADGGPVRRRLRVSGVVQGVGFRPFVHDLATGLGLAGHVGNNAAGVVIEVEGAADRVDAFTSRVATDAPALAVVDRVDVGEPLAARGEPGFRIVPSDDDGPRRTLVSPDAATCPDCLRELGDPADRRHGHPLVNCTNCGPRYSIVVDVPYDRHHTTMAGFEPCAACAAEYADPADRRFHAQPVCCPDCGPRVRLVAPDGDAVVDGSDGDAIRAAARLLAEGGVVAVKGVGGHHLAAVADDEAAVARLRAAKHREDKPFAVMVADLDGARALAEVDATAADLLTSPARPIVLLPRRPDAPLAAAVAPGNRRVGVMVAYTGLHHLLLAAVGRPIVLTSGNVSDEPIAFVDDDAVARLGPMVDALLVHDRPIHVRVDDSVATVVDGEPTMLRRSRGYAPSPIRLTAPLPRHVLAVGAHLKNTFCLARDDLAFVSQHVGDLDDWAALQAFTDGLDHLAGLFDVAPEVVAHDLHPEYLSTRHALDLGLPTIGVQHHHAHIASCLADNLRDGPVIGVAFDGTGYGTDGTIWGGEVLLADLATSTRLGHLAEVPLPGGEAAIRHPWRMAVAHLAAAGVDPPAEFLARHRGEWAAVTSLLGGPVSPATTSVGRLFDAAAALVGVRDTITYEGQAAIEFEQLADLGDHDDLPATVVASDPFVLQAGPLVRGVVEDLATGREPAVVAARFHGGVAALVVQACELARERTGVATVALSGGVFQNARLVADVRRRLGTAGFEVLTHRRVPPNDGGISLGQVAVAGARDRAR